ncbi:GIP [Symbiodinium natans]|uniref:GIP protein n=1 Tax=Symbiodinium natans TaxID=878477 RepID=A0A812L9T8_9DINO|nr:GIP [Symbiodinium natans]
MQKIFFARPPIPVGVADPCLTDPACGSSSAKIAYKNGDVFSFLKRKHTILESGILVETSSSYIRHMAEALDVKHGSKYNTPYFPELIREDVSGPLDPVRAGKFRSALGIALYLSSDRIDICYSVRLLAGFMANPSEQAWKGLIRLTKYLLNTAEYGTLLSAKLPGSSVFREASHDDMNHRMDIYSDSDWSGHRVTRKSFGSASYALNGCVFHHICRSHRTVSLSSAEAEWYAAISAACEGIFLRAIFVFMVAAAECSLDLKIDNSAARQLALRQGVGNKTRHVAGRLLWLQQSVREKVLDVGAIASAYNLGDLSTKMHSANRLRALLFLHGFVDALTGAAVGEDDFARMALQEQAKLQVKRVRVEYARQHGVTGSLKGEAGKLTKQVALLTLLCLPTTSEAAEAGIPYQSYGMSNMTWATVLLCCCLCIYRALSWARDLHGFDMNSLLEMSSQDFASKVIMCGLMPECTMEQYMCFFLLVVVWTMHRYILRLECELKSTCTEPVNREPMGARSSVNVKVVIPQELFVTLHGECFHHKSCGVLKTSRNPSKRLSLCSHCKDMLTNAE